MTKVTKQQHFVTFNLLIIIILFAVIKYTRMGASAAVSLLCTKRGSFNMAKTVALLQQEVTVNVKSF